MKTVRIDYIKVRGLVEWGWSQCLSAKLGIHKNMWGKRMDGTIPFKMDELNQFARVLNELGEGKYGKQGWEEIGADDLLIFEDTRRNSVKLPKAKKTETVKNGEGE